MVGVYTCPVDANGRSLLRQEEDHQLPAEEDLLQEEGMMEPLEIEDGEEIVAEAREVEKDVGDLQKWTKMVQEATNFRIKSLVFAETVEDRKAMNVFARIYARLRALGLPVLRLHSNRVRELVSAPVRKFAEDRGIYKTTVPGDSYKENGRAEQVGALKRATRTILCASEEKVELWPLALRQAAERMLRETASRARTPGHAVVALWHGCLREEITSGGYWVRSCVDGRPRTPSRSQRRSSSVRGRR